MSNTPPTLPNVLLKYAVPGLASMALASSVLWAGPDIQLEFVSSYSTGIYDGSAAEIVAVDSAHQRIFVANVAESRIDVLDISSPASPTLLFFIDVKTYGKAANSVAVNQGVLVGAVEAKIKTDPGHAVFFDINGNFLSQVEVGALPDMITFTPDGRKVLVANEGEPNDDYSIDPLGSVSIIDLQRGAAKLQQSDVVTVDFKKFNDTKFDRSVRIFGPGATPAQDFEPEYIAISSDSQTAWVTLQENNAIAILDIPKAVFTDIVGLGFKDHLQEGNGLDASDRDSAINIANWPVKGMYQPDGIAAFKQLGKTYLITANEGDARDYAGLREEIRVGNSAYVLDPTAFPNASDLKKNARLGRLTASASTGDLDGDGDFDEIHVFGARSFAVWDAAAHLLWDSGDQFEQITASAYPANFNAGNTSNSFDDRSDNKGPEPEGVTVGNVAGVNYAFIGLERIGGIMIYDLSNPLSPRFVSYTNRRDFTKAPDSGEAGDLGPEGLMFVPANNRGPIRDPLLVVGNEVSGTVSLFRIVPKP